MNWMGGVRNRLKVRNDRKRQQDFFEKQKFTNKQRKLETSTCPSQKKQAVSLDLVSLQAANFSAAHFKKHGSKKTSDCRINRVDLDKSRGLFRQKFVNLPDASPETKPSALNLNKPSPQENVSCPNVHLTSQRHTLSTNTEDSSHSLIQSDTSDQDLSQMLTCQREQSNFWTSTPANFWHKRKKKRLNGHNVILDSKCSTGQVDDHDAVKKEPKFHSHYTSEKFLLDSSREQKRTIEDGEYWAGKTPGSSTSGWSDLSTIMEDTDEATVPSMDNDECDYQDVGSNWVSSQSFSESVQSHDVPTSQWTLETAGEEPLLEAPDSTLNSFKDCHKIEYPIGGLEMDDSTRLEHQLTASEQYSSSQEIKGEYHIGNHPHPDHITTNYQPANTLQAHSEVLIRTYTMDPTVPKDQLIAKKVRQRVQVEDERQSRNQNSNTDHQTLRPAHHDPLLHQYADTKEQRDLACHESSSFTSPEDSGTYLMTERAKMDNCRQHPRVQDSKAGQRHHWYNDTSWQYPTSHNTKAEGGDVNSDGVYTSTQELTSAKYSSNDDHYQKKNLHPNRAVGKKFTRGQISGHEDPHVDIMNLYSCKANQILPVGDERRVDMMQVQPGSQQPSILAQIQDNGEASLVDNLDENKSSIDVDSDGSNISDINNEYDAESIGSTDCTSTDDSTDMDLAEGTDASSVNNWLDFVHADASGVNRPDTEREAIELQGDERLIKDVPATAQQMLEEVLALDRELQKDTLAVYIDDVGKNTCILVDGKDRTVEKLSDKRLQLRTEDTLPGVEHIKSQVPDLKTMLASSARNTKSEETEREQVYEAQGIDIKGRQGQLVEGHLSSNVSSSQTAVTSLQVKSPDMMTKTVCDNSGSIVSQTGDVSTTVVFIDHNPGSSRIMPSIVPTSTSAQTVADPKTQGDNKVLCDSSVQCTLIGDPLPLLKGRERLEVSDSYIQSSGDITMPSRDVMIESSVKDSIADAVSSQENGFESCVSTP